MSQSHTTTKDAKDTKASKKEAVCQCAWPEGATYVECHRHLDVDGKPIKKFPRLWALCNAGARGESPGVRYWKALEEGRTRWQRPALVQKAVPYPERVERTIATLLTAAQAQILGRRRRWNAPRLSFDECRGLCGARVLPEIEATLRFCVERCLEFQGDRCGHAGLSCQARTLWLERIIRQPCKKEEEHAVACRNRATRFVTLDDLRADTLQLVGQLPPTITRVIAIARSGLLPGSIVATRLHLPLWSTSPGGFVDLGTTYRLKPSQLPREDHVLLIDDTAHQGVAMRRYANRVRGRWPDVKLTRAVIYSTVGARKWIDLCPTEPLPAPHYLEWHLFNSPFAQAAFDFDGVLCHDIAPEDDGDGPRYLAALQKAKPKYYARFCEIPLIVTARLDRPAYRQASLDWLARHGIRVGQLVMGPWKSLTERNQPGRVPAWKASIYKHSSLKLFIESCPDQARRIAREAGKPVLSPAARIVFQ